MNKPNETIVDRIVQRLKAQPLGDLITEEDLHDIIKQAIPRVFFDPVKVETQEWGNTRMIDGDPLIITLMREQLRDAAKTALNQWIKDNGELLAEKWKAAFDVGIIRYVDTLRAQRMRDIVRNAMQPAIDALNEERRLAGKSIIGM